MSLTDSRCLSAWLKTPDPADPAEVLSKSLNCINVPIYPTSSREVCIFTDTSVLDCAWETAPDRPGHVYHQGSGRLLLTCCNTSISLNLIPSWSVIALKIANRRPIVNIFGPNNLCRILAYYMYPRKEKKETIMREDQKKKKESADGRILE
jgi:hypothetical protein